MFFLNSSLNLVEGFSEKMANYKAMVETLRSNFKEGITLSRQYRLKQLNALMKMYEEGEDELVAALKEDLSKPNAESLMFEIEFNKDFIKTAIDSMERYRLEFIENMMKTLFKM